MVRDFTEETKTKLSNEIDDINKSTWCKVTDTIGDAFLYAGKWIGFLSLDDDMSNVESYQRSVLDMSDTTKKKLEQIFEDVYAVDKEYKNAFGNINDRISTYNEKLKFLCSTINPNFSICDADTIRAGTAAFDNKLRVLDGEINKKFERDLDWCAKEAALTATKGFFGSLLHGIVDVLIMPGSMIKNVVTGNYIGIFTDTWGLIDDVFAVGSNAAGLGALGIGYLVSYFTGNSEQKHLAVEYGESYGGVSGLTEALEADEQINGAGGLISWMKSASERIDALSTGLGLFSDCKKFLDDPSKIADISFGFDSKLDTVHKVDMLDEYKDDYRQWQALYRRFGKKNHVVTLKNIETGYGYLESFWNLASGESPVEDLLHEALSGSNKLFSFWEDMYDFGEDVYDGGKDIWELGGEIVDFIGEAAGTGKIPDIAEDISKN